MLSIPVYIETFKLYVSIIDTKARVLESARNSMFSDYSATLMEEVERLDEIKKKMEALLWAS